MRFPLKRVTFATQKPSTSWPASVFRALRYHHEIAEALELSVGSVGTTLARARRRLAETYDAMQREADARQARRGGYAGA